MRIRKLRFQLLKKKFKPSFFMVLRIKQVKRKQNSFQRFKSYNKLRIAFKKGKLKVLYSFNNKYLKAIFKKKKVMELLTGTNLIAYTKRKKKTFFFRKSLNLVAQNFINEHLLFFYWKKKFYNRAFIKYLTMSLKKQRTKFCSLFTNYLSYHINILKNPVFSLVLLLEYKKEKAYF